MSSATWVAACAHPETVLLSGSTVAPASPPSFESVRYSSVESGRVRPDGVDLQAWHVRGMFPATQTNAQVKGAAKKRAAVGPYPWRPSE